MTITETQSLTTKKKVRDSNIELFRIFLMLMIIAHHYVVNSGITKFYDFDNISDNQLFLELWGWGGKVGINCFLLITGYFMCKQKFTWKKFFKLYFEVKFYAIVIFAIFVISSYQALTAFSLYQTIFNVAMGVGHGFTASFIFLYLLIPFINKLINSLDKHEHGILVLILLVAFSVFGTFFLNPCFEYLGWYITVYIIGAYIRLYPYRLLSCFRITASFAIIALVLSWASILMITYLKELQQFNIGIYYFVNDSNRILSIISAIAFFCFFKSINLGQSRVINTIASCTFGVLLIHAHSDTMRQWLWGDMLHVSDYFSYPHLWLHAIGSLFIVYTICIILDLMRQRFLERPFFDWLTKRFPCIQ